MVRRSRDDDDAGRDETEPHDRDRPGLAVKALEQGLLASAATRETTRTVIFVVVVEVRLMMVQAMTVTVKDEMTDTEVVDYSFVFY